MFGQSAILKLVKWTSRFADFALPNLCFGCRKATCELFCASCFELLQMPASTSLEIGSGRVVRVFSALPYTDVSRGLIHSKFVSKPGAFVRAAGLLSQRFGPLLQGSVVCPVPSHWTRRVSRGFDQADILAREFAGQTCLPYASLLKRIRRTEKQSKQSDSACRKKNLKDAFRVNPKFLRDPYLGPSLKKGELTITLVDDLFTSGSTIGSAAKALFDQFEGLGLINGLCLARTV